MNLNSSIDKLIFDVKIKKILTENNISTIEDLWNLQKRDLKQFGLTDLQIKQIIIKLQLNGLDLNQKKIKC